MSSCPPQPWLRGLVMMLCVSSPLHLFLFSLSSLLLLSPAHIRPFPLSLSYSSTALSVTHRLTPALSGHHLHHLWSSSCLRFARWTQSPPHPQPPFQPRRVPGWQRSPFPGWASGERPWWQLQWGSCWSCFWWSSSLCSSAPSARAARTTASATMRCWAPAGWCATPSPALRAQACTRPRMHPPPAFWWTTRKI